MQVWPIRPLDVDDSGKPITTADHWAAHAQTIRDRIKPTLGEQPASQYYRGCDIGKSESFAGVTRTLVNITVDDGDVMPAWLLEPSAEKNIQRAAVAFHQTTPLGKDEAAGVRQGNCAPYGLELAQRGWTVLAPDQLAVETRYANGLKPYDTVAFYERFPKWSAIGKMLIDGQAAMDALDELPQTRGLPQAVIGHSLGAQTANWVAAFDQRPQAVVANCGISPFADAAGRDHWFRDHWYIYLKDQALKQSVQQGPQPLWDKHELAALAAPRGLWMAIAPNDAIVQAIHGPVTMTAELHKVYNLLEADHRLAVVLHNDGHCFDDGHRAYAYHWMEQVLAED